MQSSCCRPIAAAWATCTRCEGCRWAAPPRSAPPDSVCCTSTRGDDVEDVEGEALEALLKTALEAVCGATKTPPRPLWTLFTMQRVHNDSSGGGGEGRLATGAQLGVDLGCEASLAAARDAWRQLAGAVGAEEGEDRRELFPADEGGEAGSDDDDLALLQEGLDDDLDLDGDF